jgi:hypothetical protein
MVAENVASKDTNVQPTASHSTAVISNTDTSHQSNHSTEAGYAVSTASIISPTVSKACNTGIVHTQTPTSTTEIFPVSTTFPPLLGSILSTYIGASHSGSLANNTHSQQEAGNTSNFATLNKPINMPIDNDQSKSTPEILVPHSYTHTQQSYNPIFSQQYNNVNTNIQPITNPHNESSTPIQMQYANATPHYTNNITTNQNPSFSIYQSPTSNANSVTHQYLNKDVYQRPWVTHNFMPEGTQG